MKSCSAAARFEVVIVLIRASSTSCSLLNFKVKIMKTSLHFVVVRLIVEIKVAYFSRYGASVIEIVLKPIEITSHSRIVFITV